MNKMDDLNSSTSIRLNVYLDGPSKEKEILDAASRKWDEINSQRKTKKDSPLLRKHGLRRLDAAVVFLIKQALAENSLLQDLDIHCVENYDELKEKLNELAIPDVK